jgi:hypothetical protein
MNPTVSNALSLSDLFPHCRSNAAVPRNVSSHNPPTVRNRQQQTALCFGSESQRRLPSAATHYGAAASRQSGGGNGMSNDGLVLAKLAVAVFMFLVGLPVMLSFSWLREMSIFWMNEGGYPVWLREVVLDTYYPIFFINVVLMMVYVGLLLRVPPRTVRSRQINFAVLALMAAAIAFAVIYTVADNFLVFLS